MCCKIYITKMKSCIHSCIFGKCIKEDIHMYFKMYINSTSCNYEMYHICTLKVSEMYFIWKLCSTSNVHWRYIKKNATEMQLECTFNAPLMCCKMYITKMKSCIHSCIFGKCTLNVH